MPNTLLDGVTLQPDVTESMENFSGKDFIPKPAKNGF